jgi:uncharacterized protein (TIGR04141 family)
MASELKKKLKYSIYLGTKAVKNLSDILTEKAKEHAQVIPLRNRMDFKCRLYFKPTEPRNPEWSTYLNEYFQVEGRIKSKSAAAVLIFRCQNRILACTYGHGHMLLDNDNCENDFGLLVVANSISDENVKLVEKANLDSVIRDITQAAGITRLQEFNVDRALSLMRKLSGNAKDNGTSLSGACSITLTSEKGIGELHELGERLLELYNSKSYRRTAFGIIDKLKPVMDRDIVAELDQKLVENINSEKPSFELGAPEVITEPTGDMTISKAGCNTRFPDISLSTLLNEVQSIKSIDQLRTYKILIHSIDDSRPIANWTVYKGLVGSLDVDDKRYALNEGKWYCVNEALQTSANQAFAAASAGLDNDFLPWPIIARGERKKDWYYEIEKKYNERICEHFPERFLLFDEDFVSIPNNPGRGNEICDLFDVQEKRLIHVKRSGRRSSIISHFLMQGMNSARLLRQYPLVKNKFFDKIKSQLRDKSYDDKFYDQLISDFPYGWTVEYKFGDIPNSRGEYTIPFFSRVTFDEVKREIEALGFKAVRISFIKLSNNVKK